MFQVNKALTTDGYKFSHKYIYPSGTTELLMYIESRSSNVSTVFFGLQMFLTELANTKITKEMVLEADEFCMKYFSRKLFDIDDWMYLVNELGGKIPVEIKAAKEGKSIPTGNVLVTIRSTDERLFWMAAWIETALLRAVWYPTTVATRSNALKRLIYSYLLETSEDIDSKINFQVHGFGARGVSSGESAGIGSCAHLSSFMGDDTLEGIYYANHYYNSSFAGFSIPASEHSVITSYTKEHELDAHRNVLTQFGQSGAILASVCDSFDLENCLGKIWGEELKQAVIDSGAKVVLRLDSGDPPKMVMKALEILDSKFGSTINSKGYKVLNFVKILQGDGVSDGLIRLILFKMKTAGFATDNIAWGVGGWLLQDLTRDTFKFACKLCLIKVNDKYIPVFKDPITDEGKKSKSGNLDLIKLNGEYKTIDRLKNEYPEIPSELVTVYRNGELLHKYTLDEIRKTVDEEMKQEHLAII